MTFEFNYIEESSTVDREIFANKILCQLHFCMVLFRYYGYLTNKLTLFICGRKYFVGLIFVLEGDRGKFFPGKNFPVYNISAA